MRNTNKENSMVPKFKVLKRIAKFQNVLVHDLINL